MGTTGTGLIVAAAAIATASVAAAQQGGVTLTFGLTSTARYDDNWLLTAEPTESASQLLNSLSFGIASDTRSKSFKLNTGLDLQATSFESGETTSGAINPYVTAAYTVDGQNSTFSLDGQLRQIDRQLSRSTVDGAETGTVNTGSAGLKYAFGTGQRLGGDFGLTYNQKTYEGTNEIDSETVGADVSFSAQVTSAVTLTPSYSQDHNVLDDAAGTETDRRVASLGVTTRVFAADIIDVSFGNTLIQKTGVPDTESANWSAKYQHQGQRAATAVALKRDISVSGERTSLSIDQSRSTADTTLDYGIGVVRTSADKDDVTGWLNWKQDFRTSTIDVALSRAAITDDDGTETLKTTLNSRFVKNLNERFDLSLDASYAASDETGGDSTSDARGSVALGYALTGDWQLTTGVEHRRWVDAADVEKQSNSIYVSLARTWTANY